MKFLGHKVRELREGNRWTQMEMAQKLWDTGKFKGKTRQRIHQIESGQHASARTISALCEVFSVPPETFFDNRF
ncbi:MAG: helix-turn-helix transcriptional regulator [Leptospirales bacterium]|nr:helix-turn-helix transcriptional regulator [Leptospirales bacterium]